MTAIDSLSNRRKRARYRAWHRGTQEMDLLLGPYADAQVDDMDAIALDRFELLLNEADTDLQKWLLGQEPAPADADHALLAAVLAFRTASHG